MKRCLAVLVSMVLAVSFFASCCKKSAETAVDASGKQIKIGFILGTEQEERYQRDKKSFVNTVKSLGAKVIFLSSNNDELTQANAVDSILSQGVNVLVIQPVNSDNAGVFVDKAHEKGVSVIAYDRMINHPKLDFYAGQDSFAVGTMQAEAAIAWMKTHGGLGKVMVCSGQQGHSVAEAITAANIKVLKKANVKVAAQQYHNAWGTDEALNTVENILVRIPDIKAILCNNSGMARGAIQAVEKAGKVGQIFISGADADKANIEYIVEGKQQQDVYKDEITLAATAAQLAISLAKKEKPAKLDTPTTYKSAKNIKTILTPVKSVTKENYKEVVVSAGPKYRL